MIKVITYGTFDLLHHGHIKLLERAKMLGDYLIVGVTSDDYDKTRGKINNNQSLVERIAAIKETGLADEIIVEEYEGQKIDDICRLDIDIFVEGSDWDGYFDYLNKYCRVLYLPRTEGISSSSIRAESRKLRIGVVGELGIKDKIIREAKFVNGIELIKPLKDYSNVDALYIVSKPENHYKDIKNALDKGKHVLCESPVCINESEFLELQNLAHQKGLILEDAIKTAYSTAYYRLLLIAKSGEIGEIVSVDAVCTSLEDMGKTDYENLKDKQNSICAWGPTALLPIFQLLGTDYNDITITTSIINEKLKFDGFTKIDFVYDKSVASIKIGKGVKSECNLVVTGTKGYIYVPAPWWKTNYFEIRFENSNDNKRYFYQLEGEGIRYELVEFSKSIERKRGHFYIDDNVSVEICRIMEKFYSGNVRTID